MLGFLRAAMSRSSSSDGIVVDAYLGWRLEGGGVAGKF